MANSKAKSKQRVVVENEGNSNDEESYSKNEDVEMENESANTSENSEDEHQESDCNVSDEEDTEMSAVANAGWADAISKILKTNKPKRKKTLVLSKAKKLSEVQIKPKVKELDYEVASKDGKVQKETLQDVKEAQVITPPVRSKKKELSLPRVKPSILEKDRERALAKIATKGVVQLFNAIKKQQKQIDTKVKEAGPLEVRKEKALKSIDKQTFLDDLMEEKSQVVGHTSQNATSKQSNRRKAKHVDSEPTWSVLRDDFMMGAKLKDWDKELEQEDEPETAMEIE